MGYDFVNARKKTIFYLMMSSLICMRSKSTFAVSCRQGVRRHWSAKNANILSTRKTPKILPTFFPATRLTQKFCQHANTKSQLPIFGWQNYTFKRLAPKRCTFYTCFRDDLPDQIVFLTLFKGGGGQTPGITKVSFRIHINSIIPWVSFLFSAMVMVMNIYWTLIILIIIPTSALFLAKPSLPFWQHPNLEPFFLAKSSSTFWQPPNHRHFFSKIIITVLATSSLPFWQDQLFQRCWNPLCCDQARLCQHSDSAFE